MIAGTVYTLLALIIKPFGVEQSHGISVGFQWGAIVVPERSFQHEGNRRSVDQEVQSDGHPD